MSIWPFCIACHCSVRLHQRGAGIDLDVEPYVGGLDLARDDLHHLVANIALAAGELVARLELDSFGGAGRPAEQDSRSHRVPACVHRQPPRFFPVFYRLRSMAASPTGGLRPSRRCRTTAASCRRTPAPARPRRERPCAAAPPPALRVSHVPPHHRIVRSPANPLRPDQLVDHPHEPGNLVVRIGAARPAE